MKCVKAVGVANWSVACTEKKKAWQEAGEGNRARKRVRERGVVDDVQLWTVETKRHIAVSPCLWLLLRLPMRSAKEIELE